MFEETAACYYIILVPLLAAYLLCPLYIHVMKRNNYTEKNYQGKEVVTSGGLILYAALFSGAISVFVYQNWLPGAIAIFYLAGVVLLGAVDDIWGDKQCKGFRGHLKKLWERKGVSTGVLKAAGGFVLGLTVALLEGVDGWGELLLKGIFLALISNMFNFLDTRPARAAKVFLLVSFVYLLLYREQVLIVIIPIWSALYMYLFWELQARIMLGDAGAYLLGAMLGYLGILVLDLPLIAALVVVMLFFHWYCERYSLNSFIERRRILCSLDRLGRRN